MSKQGYTVAVVGATGAVGTQMISFLEKRDFPVGELRPLASKRSAGQTITFRGQEIAIQEATPEAFEGVDIALFSAGGSISERLAPEAVKRGAVVIDNTSAFRMAPDVPLVVPEVNRYALQKHNGLIANPNCSTIQMVVALKPLYDRYGMDRVIVSTYQSVSGAGWEAIEELQQQSKSVLSGEVMECNALPQGSLHYPIAFNVIPQIDVGLDNGFTNEEMKMVNETKKIFADDRIGVTATCVRVPVFRGHSESVYVELQQDFDLIEVRELLANADGVVLQDNLSEKEYPMPLQSAEDTRTFVGRIRRDLTHERGLNMWIVSDNLLKGAATNAIEIAEALVEDGLVRRG
ncbi:aspartate-semialdehyde dehydrogenase [Thermoactinomyces sp. DSM 45891]|uniref:aspartate-semialdehyde dehydrogenase n=1 Tax=Thermoactinomyces sp. DSM 45891 TaxID=1761907 RepID=UPI0009117D80|nr:aspartate-semialdehyde dehydrogenase [Thermoactinomyces sp. DSM 45891]SFX34829.1 aspartate-semialdehyde dehydrogenase [Thermoactinomyces sp. DSM 45891]